MGQNPTDDELLRSHLLGELPDEEADRLERRLLAEDELFELAEAVEADLLAACARRELAPAERERVLQRLASSPQGRERLALARSLNAAAASRVAPVIPFARPAPAPPRPAFRWAALAASFLAVAGLSWYAAERPHGGESPPWIARERPAPASPVQAPPAPAPDRVVREKPAPPELSKAVFPLARMSARGSAPARQLRVPSGTGIVELQIALTGKEDFKSFRVTLRHQNAETAWDRSGLTPRTLQGVRALVVDVPAARLPAGSYEIRIRGLAPGREPEELSPLEIEVVSGKG